MKRVALALVLPGLTILSAVAAEHGGESHGLDPTPWKWANFILLCGLLGYFLYKRAGSFFRSRAGEIQRAIAEARKLKNEAEARLAQAEERIRSLTDEVRKLREEANAEMEAESDRLRAETELELQKIRKLAEQEIAAAGKAARQELKTYAAGLALDLAERKIRASMTPEASDALVSSFLADLERRSSAGGPAQGQV